MTESITQALGFSRSDRGEVTEDFLGGRSTSDAGILLSRELLVLVREVDRMLGLIDESVHGQQFSKIDAAKHARTIVSELS